MPYCIYTDKSISQQSANSEHILPLSLGGINGLEILVDKEKNSSLGTKIDAPMANDFLVMMKRNETDMRGHSKERPIFKAKKSSIHSSQEPIQIQFDKKEGGLRVWSAKSKRYLLESEIAGQKLTSNITLDINSRIPFIAKTALSAGYFAYGDLFRKHVEHEELRYIMNYDFKKTNNNSLKKIKTLVDHQFSGDETEEVQILKMICNLLNNHSCVGLVPNINRLVIFVGILGQYVGMVNIPANADALPNEGDYERGHFITPQNGSLIRTSMQSVLTETHDVLKKYLTN